jgi:D-sedoheptulose 7-phosphate isomerase
MVLDDALAAHIDAVRGMVEGSAGEIEQIVSKLVACFSGGSKVLICGNGGSAADAQHFAAEFMNRMHVDREPWPTIALTTDTSVLTSIANDATYDAIFARQVLALGRAGDVLIGISTSGSSKTVLAALRMARQRQMVTIGFTGAAGAERMGENCDVVLSVPSDETPRIQECHEFAYHVIAGMVEQEMVGSAAARHTEAWHR